MPAQNHVVYFHVSSPSDEEDCPQRAVVTVEDNQNVRDILLAQLELLPTEYLEIDESYPLLGV